MNRRESEFMLRLRSILVAAAACGLGSLGAVVAFMAHRPVLPSPETSIGWVLVAILSAIPVAMVVPHMVRKGRQSTNYMPFCLLVVMAFLSILSFLSVGEYVRYLQ